MNKKLWKWIVVVAAPIILVLPLSGVFKLRHYFKTVVLQPQKTGITTISFLDAARNRPLITEVWYPVDHDAPAKACSGFWIRCDEARDAPLSSKSKKYPLIVMSHGNGGDRYNVAWLAEILASNGYIVAAMDHYGNTWNNRIPECYARPWERPRDVTFVLDQLLNNSEFQDHIDESRIGFSGYSLGGATGLWIAGAQADTSDHQWIKDHSAAELVNVVTPEMLEKIDFDDVGKSFRDPRISASVLMAPALGWLFHEASLETIHIPMYIIAPENDHVVPTESNAKLFAQKIAKASLMILPGEVDHYVFLNRASLIGKRMLEPRFCEDAHSVDRKQIHDQIARTALDFFQTHLK